jgi:hypothetical protein
MMIKRLCDGSGTVSGGTTKSASYEMVACSRPFSVLGGSNLSLRMTDKPADQRILHKYGTTGHETAAVARVLKFQPQEHNLGSAVMSGSDCSGFAMACLSGNPATCEEPSGGGCEIP